MTAERAPDPALQPLQLAERRGELLLAAARQLRGRRRRLCVEDPRALPQLAHVDLERAQRRRELGVARGEGRELLSVEEAPHRGELGGELGVRAGRGRLALERAHLAAHLAHEVAEPLEVLLGRREPPLGPLLAAAVLEHAGRLLDDAAAVLGPGVEDLVELALADDHVVLAADARVAQQLLDVEQPARRAVDRVLGLAVAKERPRDRDLGHVDGEPARASCRS